MIEVYQLFEVKMVGGAMMVDLMVEEERKSWQVAKVDIFSRKRSFGQIADRF